ncbi:hypothetical protein AQF98_08865 [Pedobacter sp. Hv1]|nr:hypothetical protein AQF98_08865 [Pedobacter sp. Hv1]
MFQKDNCLLCAKPDGSGTQYSAQQDYLNRRTTGFAFQISRNIYFVNNNVFINRLVKEWQ